jgi:hypothetical protein
LRKKERKEGKATQILTHYKQVKKNNNKISNKINRVRKGKEKEKQHKYLHPTNK